jgi:hypothetical protein
MSGTRLYLVAAVAVTAILAVPAAASAAQGPGVPRTPVPGVSSLSGVTCPTATACVSVGSDDNFNGKSAVINAATGAVKVWSGDLANDPMNAVACAGTTSCLAVADDAVASVSVSGGAMKVTATPKKPASGIVALGTIACAGTTACYAAGFEGTEASSQATVVHLSSAGKLLATKKNSGTGIGAIACPSASLCLMGEHYTSGEVIQLLNNGMFGMSHTLPAGTYVQAISCYKASLCYALGGSGSSAPDELFPLNPKTGTAGTTATVSGFNGANLTCINATTCLASGLTGTGSTAKNAVVAVVKGKPGKPANYPGSFGLRDVACASASACYAVGSSPSGAIVDKVKS